MERMSSTVEGLSCDHCARAIAGALAGIEGVRLERVGVGSPPLGYDPAVVEPARIRGAVSGEGDGVRTMGRAS